MNNKQDIQIKILIPYRSYEDLALIYRKTKQMNKFEAIILSFIYVYSSDEKYKTKFFFENLYERLNLKKNKWHDFILSILKKLSNEQIITNNPDFQNDNLLCYEIELNEKIVNNLNENKFISIDNKDIEENITFNKIIFESIEDNKNHVIINKKLNEYLDLENEKNYLIDFIEKNQINKSDENEIILEAKNYENDFKYFLNIKEFNKTNYILKFNLKNIDNVQLLISNNEFLLVSLNKDIEDTINKYREHSLENLLFYTFKENEKYLNNLEQNDKYDLIPNINEYQNIIDNWKLFSKYNKEQQYLCLLNNSIYLINKKTFYWKYKNNISINLLILNKRSLLNHIKNEINKYTNGECIDLIKYLDKEEKKLFNNFIKDKINIFLKNNKIKKYFIENILTNEIENNIIWILLNSNNISFDDWKSIIKKLNKNKIDLFIKEYKNTNALEERLVYEKVSYLIELNNEEFFENYFKLSKFQNLINYLNDLKKLSENDEINLSKLIENKNLIINNIKNEIKLNYELDKKYKKIFGMISNKINTIKEQIIENYLSKHSILNIKLETILKIDENLTLADTIKNYVMNKELKNELFKIKDMRNKFAHLKEKELPNEKDSLTIVNHIQQIDEKINWLENNKEKIRNEIENNKNKSQKEKGEK